MGRLGVVLWATAAAASVSDPTWERAKKLVAQMTQDEKFNLIQQTKQKQNTSCTNLKTAYTGCLPGVPRLGVPDVRLNDGPEGFRGPAGKSTQWPSGLTVAHAWDFDTMKEYGSAVGSEFAGKGCNVMYGPAINVARIANGGRSFEYSSGEDPQLGAAMAQGAVEGIQTQGVVANAKHFMDNNQEGYLKHAGDRHFTSAEVDERTQMELYWPPFEGAIAGGALSVMCANNLINGVYACEHNSTMNGLLRGIGGFKGWTCSDYDGTRSTIDAANHGLDIALPGPPGRPDYFGAPLRVAVANGDVAQSTIDEKVTRLVYSLAVVGALDTPKTGTADTDVTSAEHLALARKFAGLAATLLSNNGRLPLSADALAGGKAGSVLLVGPAAGKGAVYGGSGSGKVTPKNPVSVQDALTAKLKGSAALSYLDGSDTSALKTAVKKADLVIVVIAQTSSEGADRTTLTLGGDELVWDVVGAQSTADIVVVAISPGPFLTNWRHNVSALVDFGLPGEQEGNAVVDVLFGDVNPSGKLPHTLPNRWNETNMSPSQYPGTPPHLEKGEVACSKTPTGPTSDGHNAAGGTGFAPCVPTKAVYSEGLLVGYRWYDANMVTPAFPFGHGLSYTKFTYSGLKVSRGQVEFSVTNAGNVPGMDIAQLYTQYPPSAGEPPQVLRGWAKPNLQPGETKKVQIALSDRSWSVWNVTTHDWQVVEGTYKLMLGASSRDIKLTASYTITA